MAYKKRFTAKYEIDADTKYVCSVSKNYEDVYNLRQEIDSSLASNEGFVSIFTSGDTLFSFSIALFEKSSIIYTLSNIFCRASSYIIFKVSPLYYLLLGM